LEGGNLAKASERTCLLRCFILTNPVEVSISLFSQKPLMNGHRLLVLDNNGGCGDGDDRRSEGWGIESPEYKEEAESWNYVLGYSA
jgi:hypothetical protein